MNEDRQHARKGMKISGAKIFEILSAVIAIIATARTMGEMPWRWFCVIMLLIMIYCLYICTRLYNQAIRVINVYRKALRKLDEEAKKSKVKRSFYYYDKKIIGTHFRKKLSIVLDEILQQEKVRIAIVFGIVIFLLGSNPRNLSVYGEQMGVLLGIKEAEKPSVLPHTENEMTDLDETKVSQESDGASDTIDIIRGVNWRFILDDPVRTFRPEQDRMEEVFFEDIDFTNEWKNEVLEIVNLWQKFPNMGIEYSTITDERGNTIYTFIERERNFKSAIEQSAQYMNTNEWLNSAPHSSEWDECIRGRERLNEIEIEGEKGCYQLWWQLANDYQYYALEYEAQTENGDAILYYYVNSIYCCMQALKYNVSDEQYELMYHYLVMRYHDLYRDDCLVSKRYKEMARDIYSVLVSQDARYR